MDFKVICINAIGRIFQLEALLNPKNPTEGVHPWQRLVISIFEPKNGKLVEASQFSVYLGKPEHISEKSDEEKMRAIIAETEREMNLISKKFGLGVAVKMEMRIDNEVWCDLAMNLENLDAMAIMEYAINFSKKLNPDNPASSSGYVQAVIRNFGTLTEQLSFMMA